MGGGGVCVRGLFVTAEDTRSSWSSSRFLLYIGLALVFCV
jgi:hypothetical protein